MPVVKPRSTPPVPLPFISAPEGSPPRKRLFIGLVTGTSVLLCLLLVLGWIVPVIGFGNIHPSVPYITGILLIICIGAIAWAAIGLVLQIATGRPLLGSDKVRGMTIKLFLPLMELLGRGLGISADEIRRSFIKVNNQLALSSAGSVDPDRLLILLPHCIQQAECTKRLTNNASACTRCGLCPMAGLLQLRDKYQVRLAIATGGTIARRIVVEAKPQLIIAVACERDLASGIQDTHPLPVFGILNDRPDGPCRNTRVAHALVEQAIVRFLREPENTPDKKLLQESLQEDF